MIFYIPRMIICSALFLIVYRWLLEKETLFQYSRAYLLCSLLLTFIIPAITFTQKVVVNEGYAINPDSSIYLPALLQQINRTSVTEGCITTSTPYSVIILYLIYVCVTINLFIRFGINLIKLWLRVHKGRIIPYHQGARLVLIQNKCTPYSFLTYIFVNETEYSKGDIDEKILYHELAHVRQRHSYDNILLELITIFFWFNPVFFAYKHFIRFNHEYLADKSVLSHYEDIVQYQHLLISMTGNPGKPGIVSRFNFLFTKKRLIMMTKTTSQKRGLFRQLITPSFVLVAMILFSNKVIAYVPVETEFAVTHTSKTEQDDKKLSPVEEFNAIHAKGMITQEGVKTYDMALLTIEDINRMRTLFLSMDADEREKLNGTFERRQPHKENIPTEEDMNIWKDAAQYGIWIDGKRINNSELSNYRRTDFAAYTTSRLMENAKDYGKYTYHLELISKEANQKMAADETLYFTPSKKRQKYIFNVPKQ